MVRVDETGVGEMVVDEMLVDETVDETGVDKLTRPSPTLVFVYCKRSKYGGGNGLGMRLDKLEINYSHLCTAW